jgi:hypothetical protein
VKASIDMSGWNRSVDKFAKDLQIWPSAAVSYQAGLLVKDIQEHLPPKSKPKAITQIRSLFVVAFMSSFGF